MVLICNIILKELFQIFIVQPQHHIKNMYFLVFFLSTVILSIPSQAEFVNGTVPPWQNLHCQVKYSKN